jgi:hypothetical protein
MMRADLHAFIKQASVNGLMITSQIYDHAARLRFFEIEAEALSH